MKVYFNGILVVLILFVSCTKRASIPSGFPDEKEMALLLADIYQVDGTLNYSRSYYSSDKNDYSAYYRYVLNAHGYSKNEFDTIVGWYTSQPEIYIEVYDEVISILSEREAHLKSELSAKDSLKEAPMRPSEVNDLWIGERSYKYPLADALDTVDMRLPFTIEVDSLMGGFYRLQAAYRFNKGDELDSARITMIACFADSTRDSVSVKVHKSFKKAMTNLPFNSANDKVVVKLEGFLLEHDTTKSVNVEIDEVKLTYIPLVDKLMEGK